MAPLIIDIETTGLDPRFHEVWEVAVIDPDAHTVNPEPGGGLLHLWQLPVDLGRADPAALVMNGYHDRSVSGSTRHHNGDTTRAVDRATFAHDFARLTRGRDLAGCGVAFDVGFLSRLLWENHECPMWNYHLIDMAERAVGYITGLCRGIAKAGDIAPYRALVDARDGLAAGPWSSSDVSLALGVNPADFARHTAAGDARWARAMLAKIR